MLVGLAHTAICVPDVEAAVAWYRSALGLTVLSPPYLIEGEAITRDMGELLPSRPVAVKAAILGVGPDDHVLEVIEYPNEPSGDRPPHPVDQTGITHVGLLCDDVAAIRADVVAAGAVPLVESVASVAGVRTTWIRDPWGVTFILVEKTDPSKPYWHQY